MRCSPETDAAAVKAADPAAPFYHARAGPLRAGAHTGGPNDPWLVAAAYVEMRAPSHPH